MEITEQQVLAQLRKVIDPDLHKDLVTLNMIKKVVIEGSHVSFTVELTTPACPLKEEIENMCREAVGEIPGVEEISIEMTANVRANLGKGVPTQQPLPGVKNIVAIASGKGGVGKSTVSANIACALAQMGAKVGLMDADIYGPSIPLIMGVEDEKPITDEKKEKLLPIERYGVKIISMGFLQPSGSAVIWRGPMVAKAVQQFLRDVEWGEIDYLIVDLPPGTGDAQLTLAQAIPLSGAVVVMTPQDLAAAVAVKAVAMFRKLDVPILGIVENMSYFLCPTCNSRHHVFSHGGGEQAAEALNVPFFGGIPLAIDIGADADQGTPSVVLNPDGPYAQIFREVAERIAAQVSVRARAFIPLAMNA
ncbi:MAG: iron-sulfur cluster carrier protein ApbC [Capsulimonas sp.]|uniref:iron-sulfur cluster carrier protein ApbC n=1 Tax=Capsulimonas sp. TaxID=2494211 RepID=UPI0032676305